MQKDFKWGPFEHPYVLKLKSIYRNGENPAPTIFNNYEIIPQTHQFFIKSTNLPYSMFHFVKTGFEFNINIDHRYFGKTLEKLLKILTDPRNEIAGFFVSYPFATKLFSAAVPFISISVYASHMKYTEGNYQANIYDRLKHEIISLTPKTIRHIGETLRQIRSALEFIKATPVTPSKYDIPITTTISFAFHSVYKHQLEEATIKSQILVAYNSPSIEQIRKIIIS